MRPPLVKMRSIFDSGWFELNPAKMRGLLIVYVIACKGRKRSGLFLELQP